MRRSVERVLTTHAGSLPRPEELRTAWSRPMNDQQQEAELQALLQNSVVNVVAEQAKIGIDVPNDGEFGKPMRTASDLAAWGTYIFNRLSGSGQLRLAPKRQIKRRAASPCVSWAAMGAARISQIL